MKTFVRFVTLIAVLALSISASGGVINVAGCPQTNEPGFLCVKAPPFSASGSSVTATTTGTTGPGSIVYVDSCKDFDSRPGHNSVFIAGAGAAGVDYIGVITACGAGTMVVSPATSTSITPTTTTTTGTNSPGTTTTGTNAPGTSIAVASCVNFPITEYITIAGAGTAGGLYSGRATACTSTTMTVSPATATSVSAGAVVTNDRTVLAVTSGTIAHAGRGITIAGAGVAGAAYHGIIYYFSSTTITVFPSISTAISAGAVVTVDNVMHDDTGAIQGALTSLTSTGGTVWLPTGFYRVNGPLQDTGGANSILQLPKVLYSVLDTSIRIRIAGPVPPIGGGVFTKPLDLNGGSAVIQSDARGSDASAVLGGYNAASVDWGPYTGVWLTLENLTIRTYDDPQIGGYAGVHVAAQSIVGTVVVDTGISDTTQITYPGSHGTIAFQTAGISSSLPQNMDTLVISGYKYGYMPHERADLRYLYTGYTYWPHVAQDHDSHIGRAVIDKANIALGGNGNVVIDRMDSDQVDYLCNDAPNALHGSVNFSAGSGTNLVNGCTNIRLNDLLTGAVTFGGVAAARKPMARTVMDEALTSASSKNITGLSSSKRYEITLNITGASGAAGLLAKLLPNGSATGCHGVFTSVGAATSKVQNDSYIGYVPGQEAFQSVVTVKPRVNGVVSMETVQSSAYASAAQGIMTVNTYTTTDYTSLLISLPSAYSGWVKVVEYTE
jgi:hypothetical protein